MLLLEGHKSPVYALAFSPDGRLLTSGSKDGSAVIWDDAVSPTPAFEPGSSSVNVLDFDPTGRRLFVGRELWEITVVLRGGQRDEAILVAPEPPRDVGTTRI